MATRIVIVEFEEGVTPQDVAAFKGWLLELAASARGLARMVCGEHYTPASETELNAAAPSVIFGNFVSVWEFNDEQALEKFILLPIHREMAAKKFRSLVKRRYVANIR